MDHGGEAARPPTTVGSTTDLGLGGVLQGSEANNIGSGTSNNGQLGAAAPAPPPGPGSFSLNTVARHESTGFAPRVRAVAAGRGEVRVAAAGFHLHHRQPGAGVGAVYPNIIGDAVLVVGPQLPGGVVTVHGSSYGYSALQRGGGAAYNGDYALLPSSDVGHGEVVVVVDLLPADAAHGHGAPIVGQLPVPGGGVTAYDDDYGYYYALQPRPGAGRYGEVPVDLLPDGDGHGEVFVNLPPGGGGAMHEDYGYYPWQPRPGAGRGEEFLGPLPDDGVGVVFDEANYEQQTLLGAGYGGSGALADVLGLGVANDTRGMVVGGHLRRLLPLAGIGACSVAVNGLAAAGPGSQAAAFDLFALLLGGLFLIILHVLRG